MSSDFPAFFEPDRMPRTSPLHYVLWSLGPNLGPDFHITSLHAIPNHSLGKGIVI
jgi:hypothetical protein